MALRPKREERMQHGFFIGRSGSEAKLNINQTYRAKAVMEMNRYASSKGDFNDWGQTEDMIL